MKLHLASFHKDREAIERTISQYNKNSAGFYATSGEVLGGLNVIHATQLIKRRLFQDINMLKRDNVLLIFDLDSQKITDVRFMDKDTAIAHSTETWAAVFQNASTRKPISQVKAIAVNVRYYLHREDYGTEKQAWVIREADVYAHGDKIPDLNILPVL